MCNHIPFVLWSTAPLVTLRKLSFIGINVIFSGLNFFIRCEETDVSVPEVVYAVIMLQMLAMLGLCSKSRSMDKQY